MRATRSAPRAGRDAAITRRDQRHVVTEPAERAAQAAATSASPPVFENGCASDATIRMRSRGERLRPAMGGSAASARGRGGPERGCRPAARRGTGTLALSAASSGAFGWN